MGEVYAAYHPDLDRRIALKIVAESGARTPSGGSALLREAKAIARLSHPNVVTVHDAGTIDDHVFIAMEFIEGQTLDAVGARAAARLARRSSTSSSRPGAASRRRTPRASSTATSNRRTS